MAKMSENKKEETLLVPSEDLISLTQYVKDEKTHYGLVASFKYEASKLKDGLKDRSRSDWKKAFEAQSKRVYK